VSPRRITKRRSGDHVVSRTLVPKDHPSVARHDAITLPHSMLDNVRYVKP
jgi:hypothetical protein